MSFADTYQHEVLQSRRDRSRRAFFWARVVGLALMITIAATLRAEPQLRSLLMSAGTNGIMRLANLHSADEMARSARPGALPTSRIKVNRPEVARTGSHQPDADGVAKDVGRTLGHRRVGD